MSQIVVSGHAGKSCETFVHIPLVLHCCNCLAMTKKGYQTGYLIRPSKHRPALCVLSTRHTLRLSGLDGVPLGLIEGDTQGFRTCGWSAFICGFSAEAV